MLDAVATGGSVEKGQPNKEDVGTSGSRRNPETHIRAKASNLRGRSVVGIETRIYLAYVKMQKSTNSA
jgi:hypothetical protein